MSKENSHLRFPSGATAEQVGKDATKIQKERPELSWSEALDQAARDHLSPRGYKAGIEGAKRYDEFLSKRSDSPNIQYCISCERAATVLGGFGDFPYCGYHANIDIDDSEIPRYKGKIPEGSMCFQAGCDNEPTKILGGACFCGEHYRDAKSGARYRRLVFGD